MTAGFVEGSTSRCGRSALADPLLVILGLWRHVRPHWTLAYEPTLWSVVFPLSMYTVATLTFGKTAHLAFMALLAQFMLWVAVAAWALVAATFRARLARAAAEPASGLPVSSGAAAPYDATPGHPPLHERAAGLPRRNPALT